MALQPGALSGVPVNKSAPQLRQLTERLLMALSGLSNQLDRVESATSRLGGLSNRAELKSPSVPPKDSMLTSELEVILASVESLTSRLGGVSDSLEALI